MKAYLAELVRAGLDPSHSAYSPSSVWRRSELYSRVACSSVETRV